jgi:hypothetical protein
MATNDGASAISLYFYCTLSIFRAENRCQNFSHGTETIKPCQEIVSPVDSFEYAVKYI